MFETAPLVATGRENLTCVCCNCQRRRTDRDEWCRYVPRAGERVTHGICPACITELYPEIAGQVYPRAG